MALLDHNGECEFPIAKEKVCDAPKKTYGNITPVESFKELDTQLLERCNKYLAHIVRGKPSSVGTLLKFEKEALMKRIQTR